MSQELIHLRKSRSKHKIGMEVPKGGSSCARCKYLVDRHYCSLAMWVNAPKRDGGGGGDPELPLPADRWCCDGYERQTRHGTRENPLRDSDSINVFVSVQPDGSLRYYRLTPSGAWTQTVSEKNPVLFGLSGEEIAIIGAGAAVVAVIGYLFWSAEQASSPTISVASGSSPSIPGPLLSGLASGYYWEDQGNMLTPGFAGSVKAIAMSPDDVASAVYGSVILPMSPSGNTTFIVTSADDPNAGLSLGQSVTLPVSYVAAA